jgi:hypothetical protein
MVSGRGMGFLFAPVSDDRDCNELEGRRGLDGYGPRSVCGDRKALVLQELNWGPRANLKLGVNVRVGVELWIGNNPEPAEAGQSAQADEDDI